MSSGSYVEKLKEKIKDITECSICTETLIDARCLPCLHSFCLKCLQTYGENKKKTDGRLECPLCRKPFTLDSDEFEGLPVNHFMDKLMDVNRLSGRKERESSSSEFCDLCAEIEPKKSAVGYCVDCRENMCSACIHTHGKLKAIQSHKTVTLDQKPSANVLLKISVSYCQTHPSQELIFYCVDCQTASCVVCYVAKHKTHTFTDIVDLSRDLSQQIEKCTVRMNDQMRQTESVMMQIDLTLYDFEKQIKSTMDSISKKYKEMKALLDSQHEKLPDHLREFRSKRLEELQTLKKESEHELIMMKSFERYWKEVKVRGSACDIVQAASSLHKRGEELVELHEKQQPQRDQSSQSSYYKVEFIVTEASDKCTNLLGQICEKVQSLQMGCPDWRSLLQSVEVQIILPAGSGAIPGITIYKEEFFIVRKSSRNIEVYKLKDTSSQSRLISVTGLTEPACIVSCGENNCLYVSSYSQLQIHRISLVDDTQRAWPLQRGHPWGLSISGQHHLLVSMRHIGHIQEYDTTGRLVRTIQLSEDIQGINHAIELESGQFVVAECNLQSRVHMTDSSGATVHTYGQGRGSSAGQLYNPIHVGVDIVGDLLVADQRNKKLRVFDNTLQYLGDINTSPIELANPLCFHWDTRNGRLVVGEHSGRVLSIKYK